MKIATPWGRWASTRPDIALDAALFNGAPEETHLRSARELVGYHAHGADGELGKVVDLVGEDNDWTVRFLQVRVGGWMTGRELLVPTSWVADIHWLGRVVELSRPNAALERLGRTRQEVQQEGSW